jgi:hypothetical protein
MIVCVRKVAAAVVGVALSVTTISAVTQWAQFRGPRGGVVADDPALPDTWSETENVAWKVPVPGRGWSSPIVWNDHVFVTTVLSDEAPPKPGLDVIEDGKNASYLAGMRAPIAHTTHRWVLYDFDFDTGKLRWERELRSGEPLAAKHPKNSYASETPVTDGRRVYVHNGDLGLFAVDFDGTIAWTTRVMPPNSLPTENPALAEGRIDFGTAASPALHGDRLFVVDDHESQEWFLAAYSTETGEELWRVGDKKSEAGVALGWASPIIWESGARTEVVVIAGGAVRSYDTMGKPLWVLNGLGTNSTPTPVVANGLLYVGSGYPADQRRPVWAIRPGATGDISLDDGASSNEFVAWSQPKVAAYMPSALVYGKYLYTLASQGFFQSNDAASGDQVYGRRRIDVNTSGFTASPWAYNGRIFALSEDGDTYVIQPGPEFKVIGKNSLGEMALATPAVVRGSLLLRTVSSLYRIAR